MLDDLRQARLAAGFAAFEQAGQKLKVARARRGFDAFADFAIERDQPDGIALFQQQVPQSGCELPRVIQLRQRLPRVRHAPRAIDNEVAPQVGFVFVLLDEVLAGLAKRSPVDVPNFIAGVVLPMLDELDAGAFEGALVLPNDVTLDEQLRDDLQPPKLGQRSRVSQWRGLRCHAGTFHFEEFFAAR